MKRFVFIFLAIPIACFFIGTIPQSAFAAKQKICINRKGKMVAKRRCRKRDTTLDLIALNNLIALQTQDAPQGPAGPKGDKGDKGSKGDTGLQGARGLKGDKGDSGSQGERGLRGYAGLPGPQGIEGTPGISGYERLYWSSPSDPIDPSQTWGVTSTCPSGKKIISGGCYSTSSDIIVYESYASSEFHWHCSFLNRTSSTLEGKTYSMIKICANVNP